MAKDRKRKPTGLPDIFDDDDDELPLPPPPQWEREPGAPELIDPQQDSISKTPILLIDEKVFMEEVAGRINGFLATHPKEAQYLLSHFIEFRHELVSIYETEREAARIARGMPEIPAEYKRAPGLTIGALLGALMQTHHGTGYVLKPVILPDPDHPGEGRIVKFVVEEQEELEEPQS